LLGNVVDIHQKFLNRRNLLLNVVQRAQQADPGGAGIERVLHKLVERVVGEFGELVKRKIFGAFDMLLGLPDRIGDVLLMASLHGDPLKTVEQMRHRFVDELRGFAGFITNPCILLQVVADDLLRKSQQGAQIRSRFFFFGREDALLPVLPKQQQHDAEPRQRLQDRDPSALPTRSPAADLQAGP